MKVEITLHTIYLSLGSNLGDRLQNLRRAVQSITESVGFVTKQSKIYETQSWGYSDSDYLNMAIAVQTTLPPTLLLKAINTIETQMGRVRSGNGYEARPIDIDILFYGGEIIDTPHLTIPHPRIPLRRFVLQPMSDIAPDFVHPTMDKTMAVLLEECGDEGEVTEYFNDTMP